MQASEDDLRREELFQERQAIIFDENDLFDPLKASGGHIPLKRKMGSSFVLNRPGIDEGVEAGPRISLPSIKFGQRMTDKSANVEVDDGKFNTATSDATANRPSKPSTEPIPGGTTSAVTEDSDPAVHQSYTEPIVEPAEKLQTESIPQPEPTLAPVSMFKKRKTANTSQRRVVT